MSYEFLSLSYLFSHAQCPIPYPQILLELTTARYISKSVHQWLLDVK